MIDLEHCGTSPADEAGPWSGDRFVGDPDQVLYRAIDVDAPAQLAFRWLCVARVPASSSSPSRPATSS